MFARRSVIAHISNIMNSAVNRPEIRYLPNAQVPQELQRRLRDYDQQELQRKIDELEEWDEQPRPRGCPRKELPAEIARMMLADLNAGHSRRYVWRKYQSYCKFGRRWLDDVLADGRLERMATGNMAPAEKLAEK